MKTLFVLICCLAFACSARANTEKKTHTQASQHAATHSGSSGASGVHVQQAQASHHTATHSGSSVIGGTNVQHMKVSHRVATPGEPPKGGGGHASAGAPRTGDEQPVEKTNRSTSIAPPRPRVDRASIEQITRELRAERSRQFNLQNTPNPAITGVNFRGTGHIQGSETWSGPNYTVFRDYHHEWHDKDWWRHHQHRIILCSGGWYYRRADYWYPAWGYSTAYGSYPYDGPIYAYASLEPDQVIAEVQAALQALGYYHGPVDGLLSWLTREALADYQRDHGLYITSAIDQSTLASLGFV